MEILLREEFGSIQNFGSKAEATLWAQRQARDWLNAFGDEDARKNVSVASMNVVAQHVYSSWKSLESTLETIDEREFLESPLFGGRIQNNIIMAESPAGKALYWVKSNINDEALTAAFAAAEIHHHIVDWSTYSATAGVVHYNRLIQHMREYEAQGHANGISLILSRADAKSQLLSNTVDDLSGKIADIIGDIKEIRNSYAEKFEATYQSSLEKLDSIHEGQLVAMSSRYEDAKGVLRDFDREHKKGLDELENWRSAFREEVRLEPAARLWTGLSVAHRVSAIRSGIASLMVGFSGIILTPFVAFQTMKWIGRKFTEIDGLATALVDPAKTAELTFHYQLIFSAAVTLLWLTMFLWLMRILVRQHTMQRRLSVDAAGRAALSQTYLGLIQDGAVNENERPIVLASLFLPVTDNSVDDGPPATSLASILAAIAAGKSGAG